MTLSDTINIVYVGAGSITFGMPYAPWNHSARVDQLLKSRLQVLAIVDPNQKRFNEILAEKRKSEAASGYTTTKHFTTIYDAYEVLQYEQIDLFIIGAPPYFRGTTIKGRDMEVELVRLFGNKPVYFTEKPVSAARPDQPNKVCAVLNTPDADGTLPLIGVGYMMRYLKVVQKAKQILKERNLVPIAIAARYAMAYDQVPKPLWWAKSGEGGPAVEQMTHFCDLMRYLVGEARMETLNVITCETDTPAGATIIPELIDESKIDVYDRVPRSTAATWKFESGAVATFTHAVALHGTDYATEITIYASGHQIRIENVYTTPKLHLWDPEHGSNEVVFEYQDDVFSDEMRAFISVAARRSGKPDLDGMDGELVVDNILTSYEDACKTYEMTWNIRDKGDEFANFYRAL